MPSSAVGRDGLDAPHGSRTLGRSAGTHNRSRSIRLLLQDGLYKVLEYCVGASAASSVSELVLPRSYYSASTGEDEY